MLQNLLVKRPHSINLPPIIVSVFIRLNRILHARTLLKVSSVKFVANGSALSSRNVSLTTYGIMPYLGCAKSHLSPSIAQFTPNSGRPYNSSLVKHQVFSNALIFASMTGSAFMRAMALVKFFLAAFLASLAALAVA
jgi:hypothetical protein